MSLHFFIRCVGLLIAEIRSQIHFSEFFLFITRCLRFFSDLFLGLDQRIEHVEVVFSAFLDDDFLFGVLILINLVQIFL